jgi:hypothetical protein
MEQTNFLVDVLEEPSLEGQIADLRKKIENIRCGLFKRYEESKRAIEFLEAELEDLIKANIGSLPRE